MKRRYTILIMAISWLLCACQTTPATHAVVNKNDGTFDANLIISSSEHYDSASQAIVYSDEFSSTDNSVEFEIDIDTVLSTTAMPAVEVVPHYINETEAQRVAKALFGNAVFYDLDQTLSKDEIMQCITRWMPLASTDAMRELFPANSEDAIEWRVDQLKNSIESFTHAYEEAPADNPHSPCQWKFRKDSFYTGISDVNGENDSIEATTTVDEIPYKLSISVRNRNDYKLNAIFAYPREFIMLDQAIFRATHCRTVKPSNLQIEEISQRAEKILEQIDIGEWKIDECYLNSNDNGEYVICINAVPVLNGVPAIRLPQLNNLKSENAYASNYYLSNVSFKFSPNGDLLFFEFQSPVDVSDVLNENTAVLRPADILQKAKETLSLSDIYAYDYDSIVDLSRETDVNVGCKVSLNKIKYNLIRVKKPNTDDYYYYVPGYLFGGSIELFDKSTGAILSYFEDINLLALNAVDGSIVYMNNE